MMVQQLSISSFNAILIVQHVYHLGWIKFISTPMCWQYFSWVRSFHEAFFYVLHVVSSSLNVLVSDSLLRKIGWWLFFWRKLDCD
jgi:hypothetical protein